MKYPFCTIDANDYTIKSVGSSIKKTYPKGTTCYTLLYKKTKPCKDADHPCPVDIVKKTKKPVILEHQHKDATGKKTPIEIHAFPIFDDKDKVTHVVEYAIDITKRKTVEEALKNSEERFRKFFENDLTYSFVISTAGIILNVNKSACRMLKYKETELIGKSIDIIYPSESVQKMEQVFKNWQANKQIIDEEIEILTKKGNKHTAILNLNTVYSNDEKVLYTICTLNDITDRKNIENTLLENEQRYRTLVEESKNVIVMTTRKGKVVKANKTATDLFGYSPKEIEEMNVQDLYADPVDRFRFQQEIEKKGELTDYEMKLRKKDGTEFFCSYSGRVWHATDGRILGYHGIIRDITGEKQTLQNIKYSLDNLQRVLESTMETITKLVVKEKGKYTAGHEQRVGKLACAIATEMNLDANQIYAIRIAAIVHDIGKAYIPVEILAKSGKLTENELNVVKQHPQASHSVLETMRLPWSIATIVLQHHERMDGSGYPNGIQGKDIMLEARILGVADVAGAMSSHRPYRPAISIDTMLEELKKHKGTLYDSKVVSVCVKLFKEKNFTFD